MRDLMDNVHLQAAFAPKAAVTDNTAQVSSVADLLGYNSCMLAMITGTNADTDVTYTVLAEDSDDNTNWSTVNAAYLNGTVALAAFQFDDDGEPRKLGYVGGKRYFRVTVTPANNTGNFFLGGVFVLGASALRPTANPPV